MEKIPLPDFDAMKAQQMAAEGKRHEGLVRRLSEFLDREAGGDENHPAVLAKEALETGKTTEVIDYLRAQIDKAAETGDEARRGELMRWKVSLTQR